MAISKTGMQTRIEGKLTDSGFDIENMHSSMKVFLKAVCEGVTEEINANAKANVNKGSSEGQYPIL